MKVSYVASILALIAISAAADESGLTGSVQVTGAADVAEHSAPQVSHEPALSSTANVLPATPAFEPGSNVKNGNDIEGRVFSRADAFAIQEMLCVSPATGDFGTPGPSPNGQDPALDSPTRSALRGFFGATIYGGWKKVDPKDVPNQISNSKAVLDMREGLRNLGPCRDTKFKNGFEVGVAKRIGFAQTRKDLATAMAAVGLPVPASLNTMAESLSGKDYMDDGIRAAILDLRKKYEEEPNVNDPFKGSDALDPEFYRWMIRKTSRN